MGVLGSGYKQLADRLLNKVEEDNCRRAVRLTCSEDVIPEQSRETLESLKAKHSPAPRISSIPALEPIFSLAFSIDSEVILKVIGPFTKDSGGGLDSLLP